MPTKKVTTRVAKTAPRAKKPKIEILAQTGVTVSSSPLVPAGNFADPSYGGFLTALQASVAEKLRVFGPHIFTTDADPKRLWRFYRESFTTKDERQHHNCSACRQFIERFGGLTLIKGDGSLVPLLWRPNDTEACPKLRPAVRALFDYVFNAQITSVWMPDKSLAHSSGYTLGTPITDSWRHMSVQLPALESFSVPKATQTPEQFMAERREDFKNVSEAALFFRRTTMTSAYGWLTMAASPFADAEQYVKPLELLIRFNSLNRAWGVDNRRWRVLAEAPSSFCHPKSGMLGILLNWIEQNGIRDIEGAVRAWNKAKDPMNYMRPKAAPKAGTVAQAEKIVEELGLAKSLERRVAFHSDIPLNAYLWLPQPVRAGSGSAGVFEHLKPKEPQRGLSLPPLRYTWAKFQREILPGAVGIEYVPNHTRQNYMVLTAPVHEDARKLFKWDNEFAWYIHNGGAGPEQVNLNGGIPVKVHGIIARPDSWPGEGGELSNLQDCFLILLADAAEMRSPGLSLFPQCLRAELHEVRSVLEAHSASIPLQVPPFSRVVEPQAIGVLVGDQQIGNPINLRVYDAQANMRTVVIDRWD